MTDDIRLNAILIVVLIIVIGICVKEFLGIEKGERLKSAVMVGAVIAALYGMAYLR